MALIDSFIFGAYWGSRAETLSEIVDKTSYTLTALREADGQFANYYRGGMGRKKALEQEVLLDEDSIRKLCLTMTKRGELDANGFAKMGFLFGVWTGQKDDESSAVSFTAGHAFETSNLSNCCVINLPAEGPARTRLLQPEISRKILEIMVRTWNPDYAVLTSSFLRERLNVGNELGWMSYKKQIKTLPKLSGNINHENDALGHWFYLDPLVESIDSAVNQLRPLSFDTNYQH